MPYGDPGLSSEARTVSDRLVKRMADSLRDLRPDHRIVLYLPRTRVGTEWSGWLDSVRPTVGAQGLRFSVPYAFHSTGLWEPDHVLNRLSVLWQMWGWKCAARDGMTDTQELIGTAPDGTIFDLKVAPHAASSVLNILTPTFNPDGDSTGEAMPFAVTPFGPLTLAQMWAVYPHLILW